MPRNASKAQAIRLEQEDEVSVIADFHPEVTH
jgi:hypothetical protein